MSVPVAAPNLLGSGLPTLEPGAFFLDGNYSLQLNSWNGNGSTVIGLRYRVLTSDGRLVDAVELHTPNTNFSKATSTFALPAGFLLNAFVFAASGTPPLGFCFVQLQLVRGNTGAILPIATIIQDYISNTQGPSWPGSPLRQSSEGIGGIRIVSGTTPAAGGEIAETVPNGVRWALLTFEYTLTNAAIVATRFTQLLIDGGNATSIYWQQCQPTPGLTSGQVGVFAYGKSTNYSAEQTMYQAPLPDDNVLVSGSRIRTSTLSLQATDQYSLVNYTVRQWIDV